ncbi:MAG: CpaF family protein, partial [Candidatus Nanopelagicales bacterium]
MLDELHARVRSALLDADVDPWENLIGVRAVIDECLVDSGLDDGTGEIHRRLMATFTGYGRLQSLFDDPSVEEIWVNEPGRVFS